MFDAEIALNIWLAPVSKILLEEHWKWLTGSKCLKVFSDLSGCSDNLFMVYQKSLTALLTYCTNRFDYEMSCWWIDLRAVYCTACGRTKKKGVIKMQRGRSYWCFLTVLFCHYYSWLLCQYSISLNGISQELPVVWFSLVLHLCFLGFNSSMERYRSIKG